MKSLMPLHRIQNWKSALGPRFCPYENPLSAARWFFYQRFSKALEAAGALPGGCVLDVGCWEGHFLPSLLANYSTVCALDNDTASLVDRVRGKWTTLQTARDLCVAEGFQPYRLFVAKADGAALPFRTGSFDVVFCLDTLPFVPDGSRNRFVAELRRVLKTGGTAVITLPVEIGPSLLLRQILRHCSGAWLDDYSPWEFIRALFYAPRRTTQRAGPINLIGYDYRRDEEVIRKYFRIQRRKFLPSNIFAWLSPTILLAGKAKLRYRTTCSWRPTREEGHDAREEFHASPDML